MIIFQIRQINYQHSLRFINFIFLLNNCVTLCVLYLRANITLIGNRKKNVIIHSNIKNVTVRTIQLAYL